MQKILLLPGDGIGPEVIAEARKVIDALRTGGVALEVKYGLIGGAAFDATGTPLPDSSLALAEECDAVLMGAVGGPRYDGLDWDLRPEAGLLAIRSALGLFANLRPARLFPQLSSASSLKPELVDGFDVLFVRELTGGIYFGEPRGERLNKNGRREAFNTMVYDEDEIERIARVAFESARGRTRHVCSVDKANVLEVSKLWRQVVDAVGKDYPDVELTHLYVDNAAMQLVFRPTQFDVILTSNLFGDILSDLAAMMSGSIGILPSASLNQRGKGLYEPVHGSAPDIAGTGNANPLAAILSLAMLLRYSLKRIKVADVVESAVRQALEEARTPDLNSSAPVVTTAGMGDLVASFCASGCIEDTVPETTQKNLRECGL